jgi:hypothetical protein
MPEVSPNWMQKTDLWSDKEVALLSRAFLDLDLDGADLHKWCRENGINRTPGAIDAKVLQQGFFDPDRRMEKLKPGCKQPAVRQSPEAKRVAVARAKAELRNQIKLARLEMAANAAPPYKAGALEW